jgi:hypothetical protein
MRRNALQVLLNRFMGAAPLLIEDTTRSHGRIFETKWFSTGSQTEHRSESPQTKLLRPDAIARHSFAEADRARGAPAAAVGSRKPPDAIQLMPSNRPPW